MPAPAPPALHPALIPAGVSLAATLAWLIFRIPHGLDFADEMQYYGEIASLARTGRFFQDDLFLQQLGYLFVLPFFRLHAVFFPDQGYLILFGRCLLLLAYGATGLLFWRAATRLGGFSPAQKITALAAVFAWVPFQLFAFSYNTNSYLLIIALVATWITRDPARPGRLACSLAGLLAVLACTHPPAGVVLSLAAIGGTAWRMGRRAALTLVGALAAAGLVVLGLLFAVQGPGLPRDLLEAAEFTNSFGGGSIILTPFHLASWLALLGLAGLFIARSRSGRPFPFPLGPRCPPALRWTALAGWVLGLSALLGLVVNWKFGYLAVVGCLGLLLVLSASIGPADGGRPKLHPGDPALLRWVMLIVLSAGLAALFALLLANRHCLTSHFAITVFFGLLILLAGPGGRPEEKIPAELAVTGTIAGAVFAFISANGLPSFGVGAAGLIPFLVLYAGRHLQPARPGPVPFRAAVLPPLLVLMLLANGALTPYREQPFWLPFKPVPGVPAFRGIRTSPLKVRAVEIFQQALPWGSLQGKRILVLGSHPWLYFVLGGEPTTPILFMKFDGKPEAYELAALRMHRRAQPDVVLLTEPFTPPPIATWLFQWAGPKGVHEKIIPLSNEFTRAYNQHTGGIFAHEVFILTRPPARP